MTEKWWLTLLKGIVLVFFGLFAIFWPSITLVTLSFAFALFIVFDGIFNIIESIVTRKENDMWVLQLILGMIEVGFGIFALEYPKMTLAVFIILISAGFIAKGIFELILAFNKHSEHRIFGFILGALAILVGILIILHPAQGGIAYTWVLGVFALISGPITIAESMMERNEQKTR